MVVEKREAKLIKVEEVIMKKLYLAYGSNLNLEHMNNICVKATIVDNIILKDYRLVYGGYKDNDAYLTIEPSKGFCVPIGVYEISISDEALLNKYENFPYTYHKAYFQVNIKDKIQDAMIYIMNEELYYYLPSLEYINICIQGYDDFMFDKTLLEEAFNYSKQNHGKRLKKH